MSSSGAKEKQEDGSSKTREVKLVTSVDHVDRHLGLHRKKRAPRVVLDAARRRKYLGSLECANRFKRLEPEDPVNDERCGASLQHA